jgi:hypothetical protein
MNSPISKATLALHRARTFRTAPGMRIATQDEAVDYVNERGFTFFWPVKNVLCPSLWTAAAGDRPVADEHDDPGHVTWGWKDSLVGKKRVFYARVLKHRNTFISLDLLPCFYALSPNYGEIAEDYLIDYEAGKLTAEARNVYEAILQNGPMDTVALRKAARMSSKTSDAPFNKALDDLQVTFRILPVGIAEAGAWKYAFIYDIVARHYPLVVEQAHPISEWDARRSLIRCYLNSLGAARLSEVSKIFGWTGNILERSLRKMIESGELVVDVEVEGEAGPHLALPELL